MNPKLTHVKRYQQWRKQRSGVIDPGFFENFVPYNDSFYGMCRVGNAGSNDVLHYVIYNKQYNKIHELPVTKGEDPRCFLHKNIPYVVTWSPFKHGNVVTMEYKLINLVNLQVTPLVIEKYSTPTPLHTLGKNWMPITVDNELYFILTIDPVLNIVKCDVSSGQCTWVKHNPDKNNEMPYTASRGGTPFIYNANLDRYIGVGHRTHTPTRHTPYLYTITKNFDDVHIGKDIVTGKTSIEDPLSIYEADNGIYVCICNWLVPMDGGCDLYKLTL